MIRTVRELRDALVNYPDDALLWGWMIGGKNSLKEVVEHEGEVFILPAGLADVLDAP